MTRDEATQAAILLTADPGLYHRWSQRMHPGWPRDLTILRIMEVAQSRTGGFYFLVETVEHHYERIYPNLVVLRDQLRWEQEQEAQRDDAG